VLADVYYLLPEALGCHIAEKFAISKDISWALKKVLAD
jgi:hypothetical protein